MVNDGPLLDRDATTSSLPPLSDDVHSASTYVKQYSNDAAHHTGALTSTRRADIMRSRRAPQDTAREYGDVA